MRALPTLHFNISGDECASFDKGSKTLELGVNLNNVKPPPLSLGNALYKTSQNSSALCIVCQTQLIFLPNQPQTSHLLLPHK